MFSGGDEASVVFFGGEYFPPVKSPKVDMSDEALLSGSQLRRFKEVNRLLLGPHGVRPMQQTLRPPTLRTDKLPMHTTGRKIKIPAIADSARVFP